MPYDYDRLDEIVDLMLETVCTRRKTIRIAGDDYPAELVKAKFMKLDSEHIVLSLTVCGRIQPKSATSSSIYGRCCSMPRPLSATITLFPALAVFFSRGFYGCPKALKSYNGTGRFAIFIHPTTFYCSPFLLDMSTQFIALA